MKRFHVHVSVPHLTAGIRFYSQLFGTAPSVQKPDYAKWMLDDPRVNFAISARERPPGVDHLGIQAGDEAELREIKARLDRADTPVLEQAGTACCYARSDKYWVTDPAGVAWEAFHTLGEVAMFGVERSGQRKSIPVAAACCGPTE